MNVTFLIVVLTLLSLLAVLLIAIRNRERVDQLRRDAQDAGAAQPADKPGPGPST